MRPRPAKNKMGAQAQSFNRERHLLSFSMLLHGAYARPGISEAFQGVG